MLDRTWARNDYVRYDVSDVEEVLASYNIRVEAVENNKVRSLTFNLEFEVEPHTRFMHGDRIFSMGAFSYSNSNLGYGVSVGRYCSIGPRVTIMGSDHYIDWISTSPRFYSQHFHSGDTYIKDIDRNRRKIVIGNDVWIGSDVKLSKNISVGNGAVVATGAVVTRDVPDFAVVAGIPARVVKYRFSDSQIKEISATAWWNYNYKDLVGLRADDPVGFIMGVQERVGNKIIFPYKPKCLTHDDLASL